MRVGGEFAEVGLEPGDELMGVAWVWGGDAVAVGVLGACFYFDPPGILWGAGGFWVWFMLQGVGEEGVLGQGELFEFGGGIEEFEVRIRSEGEITSLAVGLGGVGVAIGGVVGLAVDAEVGGYEGLFDELMEIEFGECVEASDGLFGIELVGMAHQCVED